MPRVFFGFFWGFLFFLSANAWSQVYTSENPSADGSYTITWDSVNGADNYRLYESVDGGPQATIFSGLGPRSRSLTGKQPGVYEYEVVAEFCPFGPHTCMLLSNQGAVTVTVSGPPAPSSPGSISGPSTASTGNYTLSWAASSGTVTSYQLQERTNGGSWSTVYSGTSRSRSYNKTQNNYYDYRVRACNQDACSNYTSNKRVTVPAASITLNAPSTIARTDSTFTLSWSSVMTSSCSLSEGGVSGTSGNQNLRLPNGWTYSQMPNGYYWTKTLTMTCSVINGGSVQQSALLLANAQQPLPSVNISWSNSGAGYVGQSNTLTWSSSNASSCSLDGNNVSSNGSQNYVYNSAGNHSKTVICVNERGDTSESAIIAITHQPPGTPGAISGPSTASNASYTLSWNTSSGTVTEYQLQERPNNGSWSTVYTGTARSRSYNKTPDNYYDYRVRACNSGSCSNYTSNKRVTIPAASVSVSTSPSELIWTTDNFTLNWSSEMTTSCSWNAGSLSGTSGSSVVGLTLGWEEINPFGTPIFQNLITVTCNVIGGGTRSSNLALSSANGAQPLPVVNVSWNTSSVAAGSSATFSWSSTYADSCTLAGGGVASSGSQAYTLNTVGTETRTITCTNAQGSTSDSASISVVYPTPGIPGAISVPSEASTGSYTVSWGAASGALTRYELQERQNSAAWSNVPSVSGISHSFNKGAGDTYSYRVRACNHDQCSAYTSVANVVVPDGEVAISVSPSILTWTSEPVTLSWNSVMTTGCSWNNGALSGTSGSTSAVLSSWLPQTGPMGTTIYGVDVTVTCDMIGGGTVSDSVSLTSASGPQPAPTVSVSWSDSSIVVGNSATLTWSSSLADSCTLEGGSVATSGSQTYTLNTVGTETRTVTCTNAQGSTSNSASISVAHPAPSFSSLQAVSTRFGDLPIDTVNPLNLWGFTHVAFTFEWNTLHTSSCFARAGEFEYFNLTPSGELPFHGEDFDWTLIQFINDHRYQTNIDLTCIGLNGDQISMPLTLSADLFGEPRLPSATAQWEVEQVGLNEDVTFSWSSDHTRSCTLNGSDVELSGSIVTSFSAGGSHTWSLSCVNAEGAIESQDTVNVLDSFLFTSVQGGNTVGSTSAQIVIDWSAQNVSDCSIGGETIEAGDGSGSVTIDGVSQEWTNSEGQWQLTIPANCLDQNNEGWSQDIVINATNQGINGSVSWVTEQVMVGQLATIQWQLTGAQSCTDWLGLPLSSMNGSVSEIFDSEGEFTYAIDCEDQQGEPQRLEATLSVSGFPVAIDPVDETVDGEEFFGYVSGSFNVSAGGSATYNVPIEVPPGIRGMQPKLTIGYNSSARNGLLGWGWNISGQSRIHRCASDLVRDRFISGTMDGDEYKHCIDGERLVLVDSAAGEEYRTEKESYRKIIRNEYGGFTVFTRDGRAIEYGGRIHAYDDSADSRRVSANGSDYVEWHISRVTDIAGNYMTYHYEIDSANGTHRLERIEYTKNESAEAVDLNHSVNLVYEERDDQYSGYSHGIYSSMDKRLSRVDVRSASLLVRSYHLAYQLVDGTAYQDPVKTSRLESITVCYDVTATQCSEPLMVEWNERTTDDYSFNGTELFSRSDSGGSLRYALADIDGDGLQEVIYKSSSEVYATDIGEVATFTPDQRIANFPLRGALVGVMDLNGDGKDDLIYTVIDNLVNHTMVALTDDDGFEDELRLLFSDDHLIKRVLKFQDLNGDGHIDALRYVSRGRTDRVISYEVARNLGDGTFLPFAEWGRHIGSDPESTQLADINGDSLPDIVRCDYIEHSYNNQGLNKCRFLVSLNLGWGEFGEAQLWGNTEIDSVSWFVRSQASSPYAAKHMILADVNGDRLADVLFADENDFKVAINNGRYFEDMEVWLDHDLSNGMAAFMGVVPFTVADLNDDGKLDVVFRENSGVNVAYNLGRSVGLEDGGGFSTPQSFYIPDQGVSAINVSDLNGDGIADLNFATPIQITDVDGLVFYNVNTSLGNPEAVINPLSKNLVATISEHDESTTEIRYSPLTNPDVHTQGEGNFGLDATPVFPITSATDFVPLGGDGSYLAINSGVKRQHYVVDTVDRSDGIGGIIASEYHYTGLLTHKQGWGSLGFSEVQIDTINNGTGDHFRTVSEYSQDFGELYKAAGLLLRSARYVVTDVGTQLLNETVNEWHIQGLRDEIEGWGIHSPHYVIQREAQHTTRYDLNGTYMSNTSDFSLGYDAALPTVCESDMLPSVNVTEAAHTAYDSYGNVHQSVSLVCDDTGTYTTATQNLYENRTEDQWLLGLVTNTQVTSISPDHSGQLQSLTREQSATYNDAGFPATQTREPNNADLARTTTLSSYDAYGTPTSVVEAWTNAEGLGFNTRSSSLSVSYQSNGTRTVTATNPANQTTVSIIDGKYGQARSVTDANNLTTTSTFDIVGRVVTVTAPDGSTVVNRYRVCNGCDAPNERARFYVSTKAMGAAPQREYFDAHGRSVGQRVIGLTGTASYTEVIYDSVGRVASASEPFFAGDTRYYTGYTYDGLDRPTKITKPNGAATDTEYNGLETTITNVMGQVRKQWHNSLGQNTLTEDHLGTTIDYAYDPLGNLIQTEVTPVGDSTGVITTMEYDVLGRQLYLDDPSAGRIDYTYNGLDLMATSTDANNQRTDFTYDILGRQITRTDRANASNPALRTHQWTYDTEDSGVGRLAQVTGYDTDGVVFNELYHYNPFGLPTLIETTIQGETYTTETFYDEMNRPVGVVYPTGVIAVNHYNNYGYRHQVSRGLTDVLWTANAADARGNITESEHGNGVITTRGYENDTGFVNSIHALGVGNLVVQNHEYNYDLLGNLTHRTDLRALNGIGYTQAFCYDDLNRLTAVRTDSCSASDVDITYDALGNIQTRIMPQDGLTQTYTYDSSNPYRLVSTNLGGLYDYDNNGNITSGGGRTITYSSFDKPTVMTKDGNTVEITYGPDQNRIKRVDNTSITTTYVAGIYEKREEGSLTTHLHYIGDIALYVQEEDTNAATNSYTSFLHHDHLGSLVAKTNEAGDAVEFLANDPWGYRQDESWLGEIFGTDYVPVDTRKGFTAHEHMDGVGLIHMNGRVYDPDLGRFLSADPYVQAPMNTQSFNRYAYVFNNPLRYTDPSGFNATNSEDKMLNKIATGDGEGAKPASKGTSGGGKNKRSKTDVKDAGGGYVSQGCAQSSNCSVIQYGSGGDDGGGAGGGAGGEAAGTVNENSPQSTKSDGTNVDSGGAGAGGDASAAEGAPSGGVGAGNKALQGGAAKPEEEIVEVTGQWKPRTSLPSNFTIIDHGISTFAADVLIAVNFAEAAGETIFQELEASGYEVFVEYHKETEHLAMTRGGKAFSKIHWNPRQGLVIQGRGRQSAATGFLHEAAHALNYFRGGVKALKNDDKMIIKGIEARVAGHYGEAFRKNHSDGREFTSGCATCLR